MMFVVVVMYANIGMKKGVLDKPLERKNQKEVSMSAFAFLFSEVIQQAQQRSQRVNDLEARLIELGKHVGVRLTELLYSRHKNGKRETSVVSILSFILQTVWKHLFGRFQVLSFLFSFLLF